MRKWPRCPIWSCSADDLVSKCISSANCRNRPFPVTVCQDEWICNRICRFIKSQTILFAQSIFSQNSVFKTCIFLIQATVYGREGYMCNFGAMMMITMKVVMMLMMMMMLMIMTMMMTMVMMLWCGELQGSHLTFLDNWNGFLNVADQASIRFSQ